MDPAPARDRAWLPVNLEALLPAPTLGSAYP